MRRGIDHQIISMRHMIAFQITALGVIIGLVLVHTEELIHLLLIIPISSFIIGSLAYFHIREVFVAARYINDRIAPKLRFITGDNGVLGWDTFADDQRRKEHALVKWFTMPGSMVVIFVVPSIVSLAYALHYLNSQDTALGLWILWGIGVLLTILLGLGFGKELKSLIWG